ncbi:alpha/beta fold hydrolase [Vitiosangium sp. GDMCC 1.1324]|uniref:alpha/beta fold hydrolase n=1 Tax=Vitiosangium sp. (strain GDMCC 1.1324) TaxID=2138576 RepID=UPI000D39E87B|nr:alpha/beta hydrolase [Vitiosangium sp. GDMCC 1.1324]PTL81436.1 alpha/beta hydrolase [Vitiosangium sp. GDMCC 1.1324]
MDRRDILKSAVVAGAGAGFMACSSQAMAVTGGPAASPTKAPPASFIRTRDGVELFYRDWGTGKPVVFLSGWTLCSDMWNYQMVPLSDQGLRCIAYDRRGHGRSSDPGRGYDYDTLADDLAAVLEALDLRDVTLVGHSMASGELVRYLSRHGPGRIARLVFLAPAATPFVRKTADNPDGVDESLFEHVRNNLLLRDFPKWLADNAPPFFVADTSPAIRDWVMSQMLRCSMKATIDCHRAMSSTDFRAELPRISLPTLIIHGDKDASAPLHLTGQKTAQLIPGSRLVVYEGAPHGLFVTHTERLNGDLLAFVRNER